MAKFYLFFCLVIQGSVLLGNNIQITDLRVEYEAGRPDYALLTFNLSWENSWRTTAAPSNWDAAWIFAKYRNGVDGEWQHITLARAPETRNGAVVEVLDGTGAMVYAADNMAGNVSYQQTKLRWSLPANGISHIDGLDFRIFGIEMVYVPQGRFWLGSTLLGEETNRLYKVSGETNDHYPYPVESADAIPVGFARNMLNYAENHQVSDQPTYVPASFPNGFNAFYAMKYELSQQQYVDFFNTLTPYQKSLRDITDRSGKGTDREVDRNAISYDHKTGGGATTAAPHVPVGYVSMSDMMAYLDWSGLRPMTEMEFEKICRGTNHPVAGEYAWSTNKITTDPLQATQKNSFSEVLVNLIKWFRPYDGYAGYSRTMVVTDTGTGPLRSGIYSASAGHYGNTRVWSGAGYYGHMELSGNQAEGVITITHEQGRNFRNVHGNGVLPEDGNADVPSWPTQQLGVGTRGGHHDSDAPALRVADRSSVTLHHADEHTRPSWLQFRGVRGL